MSEATKIDTETQGCCLFCAKKAPAPVAEPEGELRAPIEEFKRTELTQLRQIINLDFKAVIGQAVDKPVADMTDPEVTALLCRGCFEAVTDVTNSYELIKELQVRLVGSLELLHDKVFSLKYHEEKTIEWQKLMMRNPQSALFLPFVEKLRDAVGAQSHKASKRFKEVFANQFNVLGVNGNNSGRNQEGSVVELSEANLSQQNVMSEGGSIIDPKGTLAPVASTSQSAFQTKKTYRAVAAGLSANTLSGTSSALNNSNLTRRSAESKCRTPEGNHSKGEKLDSIVSRNPNGNRPGNENVTERLARRIPVAPPPPSFEALFLEAQRSAATETEGQSNNAVENGEGAAGSPSKGKQPARRGKKSVRFSTPYDRVTDQK